MNLPLPLTGRNTAQTKRTAAHSINAMQDQCELGTTKCAKGGCFFDLGNPTPNEKEDLKGYLFVDALHQVTVMTDTRACLVVYSTDLLFVCKGEGPCVAGM